jgi:hypothetical protein
MANEINESLQKNSIPCQIVLLLENAPVLDLLNL